MNGDRTEDKNPIGMGENAVRQVNAAFARTHEHMKKEFAVKFTLCFEDFLSPAFILYFLLTLKNLPYEIFEFIIRKYNRTIDILTLNRKDFIKKQSEMLIDGINSTYYSFKYFNPYPFIEREQRCYLPLPHLLIGAVTDSLLTRLTIENEPLRQRLGKEVIENYLYEILCESAIYDEVVPECKYCIKRTPIFSPDVMVYKNDRYILFDCKASVPPIGLRKFNDDTMDELIDRYANQIIKLHDRIDELSIYYQPFENRKSFEKERALENHCFRKMQWFFRMFIRNRKDVTDEIR